VIAGAEHRHLELDHVHEHLPDIHHRHGHESVQPEENTTTSQ
jgi:hypothetical protein